MLRVTSRRLYIQIRPPRLDSLSHTRSCHNRHATKTQLAQVERQQRKSIRIMNFKNRKYKETDELFKSCKILPLKSCKELNSAKVLWQASNSLLDSPINSLFEPRPNGTFHIPFHGTDLIQSSIAFKGVQTWNKINSDIRTSPSLNCFKDKFKKHLIDKL